MKKSFLIGVLCCFFSFCGEAAISGAAKLSVATRQGIDRIYRTESLRKVRGEDATLKLVVRCSAPLGEEQWAACGIADYTPIGEGFYTVRTGRDGLSALLSLPEVIRVELSRTASPSLDMARADTQTTGVQAGDGLPSPYTGKGVVLGFIDSGFDVAHPAFRTADGATLRVVRFWDQVGDRKLETAADILAAGTDNEEQTHGTHVAGIAGGGYFGAVQTSATEQVDRNPYYGVAYDADLVMVGSTLEDADILDGIRYVFDYAETEGKPAVVNISLNVPYGPHDGTSLFDKAVESMVGEGRILVGSIGNEGRNRTHASLELDGASPAYTLFSPSGLDTKTVEMWGENDSFVLSVDFIDSAGEAVWSCSVTDTDSKFPVSTDVNHREDAEVAVYTEVWENGRRVFRIAFNNIYLKGYDIRIGASGTAQHVDLWTDRNSGQFTDGGKSGYFNYDVNYSFGELGGTGRRTISVGNYTTRNVWTNYSGVRQSMLLDYPIGKINYTSSWGPLPEVRVKPEVVAPGGMIMSAVSSYSSYYKATSTNTIASTHFEDKDYFWGQMTGTSQAAPFVAGVIATWLEANRYMTPELICTILRQTSVQDDFTGVCPNSAYGYGKIDALAGVQRALELTGIDRTVSDKPYRITGNGVCLVASAEPVRITVYAVDGRMLSDRTLPSVADGDLLGWDTLGLSAGIYILRIGQQSEKVAVRF